MLLLFISGIIISGLSFTFFKLFEDDGRFISILLGFVSIIYWLFFLVFGFCYAEANFKAELINKEYKTSYSTLQMLFADDVIEEIRQVQRQRVEINGNLMQSKSN